MKVVLLSGGGGGARFARGLADVLEPGELTVIGNVGDDLEILGVHVSPDLDSLLYTLGGLIDAERGWGRAGRDVERARVGRRASAATTGSGSATATSASTSSARRRCASGAPLSDGHGAARRAELASATIVPATDDRAPDPRAHARPGGSRSRSGSSVAATRRGGRGRLRGRRTPDPAPGVLDALDDADAILFAPSNPYLSIGPILAVAEIRRRDPGPRACAASP